jgi:hypothetical protein
MEEVCAPVADVSGEAADPIRALVTGIVADSRRSPTPSGVSPQRSGGEAPWTAAMSAAISSIVK